MDEDGDGELTAEEIHAALLKNDADASLERVKELVAKADGKRIRSYQTGDLIGLCEMMSDVKGGEDCTDVVANGSAALLALSKKDYTKMARASQLEPWAAAVDDALKRAHADRCVKLLRNVDFFARLSDEELSLLTPLGSFVAAKPGTIALEQDVCDPALYIVLSGALSVCVKIDDDEMKEHDLAIFRTHAAAEAESLTQKAMRAGIAADAIEDVRARGLTINVGATSEVGSLKPGDFMGEVSLLESLLKPGGEPPCFRTSASVVVQEQALFMKFDSDKLARTIAACGGELGVWMHTCGTGDALSTADALAGVGVTYVNTDFPESFLES